MIKIGIEDGSYRKKYGAETAYRKLRSLGYECIDYQNFINTDTELFQNGSSAFDTIIKREREIIEDAGLEVSQTHGPWRWPAQDSTEEEREERFQKMSISIRGTALLGCRYFVIHPVMPTGGGECPDPEEFYRINRSFMIRLAEEGRKNGVIVCLENMPMQKLPISRPEATLAFVKEINDPHLKMCLDTGHCTMFGINPAESVRNIGKEYLRVLHVHDNNGYQDMHGLPFTGVIDWDDFRNSLQEIGFEGCLSLETVNSLKYPAGILELQERSLYLSARYLAGRTE